MRRDNGWKVERYPQTVAGAKNDTPDLRNKIVKAALTVALRDGLDGVTIDELAQQSNVSSSLILQNFGSHDGVMLALLDVVLARTLDADRALRTPVGDGIRLEQMIAAELQGLREQAPVAELIFSFYFTGRDERFRGRIQTALATYRRAFESALDGVQLKRGMDAFTMSSIVVSFIQGAAVQAVRDPEFNPAQAIGSLRAMLQ
ncbi:hypothetical protein BH09ACT4_BH09ACT4_04220 [soil metagenome]